MKAGLVFQEDHIFQTNSPIIFVICSCALGHHDSQARPPQYRPHNRHGAAAAFYFAKSSHDCVHASFNSPGGPGALKTELKTLGVFDRKYGLL